MKKRGLIFIILVLIFPITARAEEVSLTLPEVLTIALRDSKSVLLKAEEISKAKAKIKESQSGFWPSITLGGSQTERQGLYANDFDQTNVQIGLKQYLYRGGLTINSVELNQYQLQVAEASLDATKLTLALTVSKTFYTLLLSGKFADLNAAILANSELRLSSVETRYNGGHVSDLELLKAKEAIANVESALKDSQGQVEALSALLNNLLALERTVEVDVEGEFAYEPKDMAIEESFLLALEERPEIKQYEAQTNAAKEGVELAKANGRPTVYASWDYYSSSHLATGAENWNDYNIYGVTVSWPIFDGWATKAKLDQAITDVKTAQLLQEKLVQDIALELKNAYVEMKNAIAQVRKSETALSTFTKDLEEIKDKTAKGIASHLDLEDAKLSYKIALFNKDQAVYNYLIAQNAFDKASGAFENQQ